LQKVPSAESVDLGSQRSEPPSPIMHDPSPSPISVPPSADSSSPSTLSAPAILLNQVLSGAVPAIERVGGVIEEGPSKKVNK